MGKLTENVENHENHSFTKEDYNEAITLAKSIGANSDEDTLYRLNELAVKWVLANPTPIKLESVSYDR